MRFSNSLYALGRKKAGEMNKTETAYSEFLRCKQLAGKILWYSFEPITLKLANTLRYTPDFAVLLPDGRLQLHEVKGSRKVFFDDARAKVKMAAQIYQMFEIFAVYPKLKRDGGGWEYEEFTPCEK